MKRTRQIQETGLARLTTEALLASALELLRIGPIIPCVPCEKRPLTRHGSREGSRDPRTVQGWWTRWGSANVGLVTGQGLIALDVDPRHGGDRTLAYLEEAHESCPATVEIQTGGGGRHLLFATPAGIEVRNSCERLGPGLDVRGVGGYVVAPPSIHPNGNRYRWREGRGLNHPLASLPSWLRRLQLPSERARPLLRSFDRPQTTRERFRRARPYVSRCPAAIAGSGGHDATFRVACHLVVGFELPEEEAFELLLEFNARCDPPWSESELRHKLQSAAETSQLPPGYLLNVQPRAPLKIGGASHVERKPHRG